MILGIRKWQGVPCHREPSGSRLIPISMTSATRPLPALATSVRSIHDPRQAHLRLEQGRPAPRRSHLVDPRRGPHRQVHPGEHLGRRPARAGVPARPAHGGEGAQVRRPGGRHRPARPAHPARQGGRGRDRLRRGARDQAHRRQRSPTSRRPASSSTARSSPSPSTSPATTSPASSPPDSASCAPPTWPTTSAAP